MCDTPRAARLLVHLWLPAHDEIAVKSARTALGARLRVIESAAQVAARRAGEVAVRLHARHRANSRIAPAQRMKYDTSVAAPA